MNQIIDHSQIDQTRLEPHELVLYMIYWSLQINFQVQGRGNIFSRAHAVGWTLVPGPGLGVVAAMKVDSAESLRMRRLETVGSAHFGLIEAAKVEHVTATIIHGMKV